MPSWAKDPKVCTKSAACKDMDGQKAACGSTNLTKMIPMVEKMTEKMVEDIKKQFGDDMP
jgi:hypothetical protein